MNALVAAVATVVIHGWPYASIDEAAKNGLIDAADCSRNTRECGGAIYKVDGREIYLYSGPYTSDRPFSLDIPELADPAPEGLTRVADYHVHICNKHNSGLAPFFSFGDVQTNDGFHTIGYMLEMCNGNIHRYAPGVDDRDDEEIDFESGRKLFLTIGHIVGWVDIRRYLRCDQTLCK
jgi:hypothetical protein